MEDPRKVANRESAQKSRDEKRQRLWATTSTGSSTPTLSGSGAGRRRSRQRWRRPRKSWSASSSSSSLLSRRRRNSRRSRSRSRSQKRLRRQPSHRSRGCRLCGSSAKRSRLTQTAPQQGSPSLRCGASCTFILSLLQRHGRKNIRYTRKVPYTYKPCHTRNTNWGT